jgi:hypothetical protein
MPGVLKVCVRVNLLSADVIVLRTEPRSPLLLAGFGGFSGIKKKVPPVFSRVGNGTARLV